MKFDPRIPLPDHQGPVRTVRIPVEGLGASVLRDAVDGLQALFVTPCTPPVSWGRANLHIGKGKVLEAVKLSKAGRVVVHRILGHPKVPQDVREAAVFLGILMWQAQDAQTALRGHVFDHPVLGAWADRQMALLPSSEFLAMWISRFGRWVESLG